MPYRHENPSGAIRGSVIVSEEHAGTNLQEAAARRAQPLLVARRPIRWDQGCLEGESARKRARVGLTRMCRHAHAKSVRRLALWIFQIAQRSVFFRQQRVSILFKHVFSRISHCPLTWSPCVWRPVISHYVFEDGDLVPEGPLRPGSPAELSFSRGVQGSFEEGQASWERKREFITGETTLGPDDGFSGRKQGGVAGARCLDSATLKPLEDPQTVEARNLQVLRVLRVFLFFSQRSGSTYPTLP